MSEPPKGLDTIPVYRRIVEDFRTQIVDGTLGPGSRLPTARSLAVELKVSRLTILKAYRELREGGLVEPRAGGGTIVTGSLDRSRAIKFLRQLPAGEAMARFAAVSHTAKLYSLVTALPDPSLLRMDQIGLAFMSISSADPWSCFLSPTGGTSEFLQEAAKLARTLLPKAEEGQICATYGSNSGLSHALGALCVRNRSFAYLTPTVTSVRYAAEALSLKATQIAETLLATDPEEFERRLAKINPDAIVVTSLGNAVHGQVMSLASRLNLLEICGRQNLTIIDHLPLGFFRLPGQFPLATESGSHQIVTNIGLDTHIAPGLSIGLTVSSQAVRQALGHQFFATSLGVSTVMQKAFANLASEGIIDSHLRRVNPIYRERCSALLHAMKMRLEPLGCTWAIPNSGLTAMVRLPNGVDSEVVFLKTLDQGVAVLPGRQLETSDGESILRLSWAMQPAESFDAGIKTLAQTISRELASA